MSQMVSLFPVLLQQGWRIMCTVKEESDDSPARDVAKAILQILADYTVNCQRGGPMSWENAEGFLPTIMSFNKTLGVLPDLGEELALQHLNGLCLNIPQIYLLGAEVRISSDGLVHNDILGVPDEVVWDYGEALRQIAVDQNLAHIRFIRLADLLEHPRSTKEFYVAHASRLRREPTLRFQDPSFDPREAINADMDLLLTSTPPPSRPSAGTMCASPSTSKTKFSTCVVRIENAADGGARLIPVIDRLLYDYWVCLRLAWEVGDVLVNDNTAMLHTRTAY
ncbi:uncharacterized protein BO95DRAFT_468233 [Aspergillus brunneoviolaceus CBS 621.78]|uniref:Uncharacterized protein n=1 Tax=Aspergillus brunneoviolaceus CBS 621.78 TaxID=1450534 RepID=A0ACD1FVP5_9EURO|nr:hypothetical protein BO95DRAFT_468233 [Aspergillus brunneoviolaceus CBS 621.78]RAH41049.1 hypothetical protein BO95DRAFT_468233 [Aspergillus brunneoviolaceus CBS 621.78]